jgi:hypothetical protein
LTVLIEASSTFGVDIIRFNIAELSVAILASDEVALLSQPRFSQEVLETFDYSFKEF